MGTGMPDGSVELPAPIPTDGKTALDDVHVTSFARLLAPAELYNRLPLPETSAQTVWDAHRIIGDIIAGRYPRKQSPMGKSEIRSWRHRTPLRRFDDGCLHGLGHNRESSDEDPPSAGRIIPIFHDRVTRTRNRYS